MTSVHSIHPAGASSVDKLAGFPQHLLRPDTTTGVGFPGLLTIHTPYYYSYCLDISLKR